MDLENLISDDRDRGVFRVNRSSFLSPEILELERQRVFDKCWLYVGHESEINEPGDYKRRDVGRRPLIFCRNSKGEMRVLLNTCTHRGAVVCRQDQGNASNFQCFYHAWTFNNNGDLVGLPDEAGYGKGFNKADMALPSPPRVESYRGFVFTSFNPQVEDLVSYLADAKDYLDLVADQSEAGMNVIPGTHKYCIKANWKLLVENSIDGYHAPAVHATYFTYLKNLGTDLTGGLGGRGRALGNGHAVIEYTAPWGRPIAKWEPRWGADAKEEITAIRQKFVEKFGEERAHRITDVNRNLLIFPNLIINDIMSITIRAFTPVSPDFMEVTAWEMAPHEEGGELLARRLDSFLTFLGPGGFATPDDIEALEACQKGFQATEVQWSDISRGMKRDPQPGDERQMRAFWRRWHALMTGREEMAEVDETQWHDAAESLQGAA
jgi:p-cumate 2,3-dioxygenase alpha subunit